MLRGVSCNVGARLASTCQHFSVFGVKEFCAMIFRMVPLSAQVMAPISGLEIAPSQHFFDSPSCESLQDLMGMAASRTA